MITVGILVSYLIALAVLIPLPQHAQSLDWRLLLGLGAVPALFALVLRTRMPESPRWLMRQGRYDDTRAALGKLGVDVSAEQMNVIATYFAFTFVDKVGRRKLAISGYAVMTAAMLLGGIGVALTDGVIWSC